MRDAFHTEIHSYLIQGVEHHANNGDPQIPAALAPVVAGVTPMNDFRPKANLVVLGQAAYNARTHQVTPEWTLDSADLALAPGDFAVQYDLNPLYSAGTNGAGVTIGIIGDSNVSPAMVASYRTLFGLPANALNVVVDGNDPGLNGAVIESYLDVEVSGAVAPGATINLYTAAATNVQDGLYLAAVRAVGDDVASVLSTSYGECEKNIGAAGNQFWASIWEQAAARGRHRWFLPVMAGRRAAITSIFRRRRRMGSPSAASLRRHGISPWAARTFTTAATRDRRARRARSLPPTGT